jgi:hypothetical protein
MAIRAPQSIIEIVIEEELAPLSNGNQRKKTKRIINTNGYIIIASYIEKGEINNR